MLLKERSEEICEATIGEEKGDKVFRRELFGDGDEELVRE